MKPLLAFAACLATAMVTRAGATCIQTSNIDHIERPSDKAVTFYLRSGEVYRNDLPQRCFGLQTGINGITYTPTIPGSNQLCDNLGTFKLNDTPGADRTCLWGAFTRLK